MNYDLVVRGGTVLDGSGTAAREADVAIQAGRIAAVGKALGRGKKEIDARGRLVTPGFIDIHTHYDGQVTWEHRLSPSSSQGVTTVVMGNCGVGFAPCRPEDHERLINIMEGVEDIPQVVMAEGIPWNWETFAEYLEALSQRQFDIDVATQVPHSPLRIYVMGERGMRHEPATEADCEQMSRLVSEAVTAGAVGVSTSRSGTHRTKSGELAPSVATADAEVLALARGLGAAGMGVFQVITDPFKSPEEEFAVLRRIAEVSRRPVSFSLVENPGSPEHWRRFLALMDSAASRGLAIRGQVAPRPVGMLFGLDLSFNPFCTRPAYRSIAALPLQERVAIMREPAFRTRLLAEKAVPDPNPMINMLLDQVGRMFVLNDPPDYAPPAYTSLQAAAQRTSQSVLRLAYDELLGDDGHAILFLPAANYARGDLAAVRNMMLHEHTLIGLGDGGAHYGLVCDASYPAFLLTHWTRDVAADQRVPLEWAVQALTNRPARTMGFADRGLLAAGFKADLNVIDYDSLILRRPRVIRDLPAGGQRLTQEVGGIDITIVSGVVTYGHGTCSGELPGRLLRSVAVSPGGG